MKARDFLLSVHINRHRGGDHHWPGITSLQSTMWYEVGDLADAVIGHERRGQRSFKNSAPVDNFFRLIVFVPIIIVDYVHGNGGCRGQTAVCETGMECANDTTFFRT